MAEITVLVTCAASLVVPSTLQALQQNASVAYRFVGVDASPEPLAGEYLADFYLVPRADETGYVKSVLEVVKQSNAQLLLVLSDAEALVLSEPAIRSQLEAVGCQVLLPAQEIVNCCVDKGLFMAFLQQDPNTAVPYQLIDHAPQLSASAALLEYPAKAFIVKPRRGCGSRGVMLIDATANPAELLLSRHYRRFTLDFVEQTLHERMDLDLLAMPWYGGKDYNIDVLCQAGQVVYSLVQQRVSPVMGAIMTAQIVDEEDINALVSLLVRRLNVTGLINIEIARCLQTGLPAVYEINPRPSAAFAFLAYQGVDILADVQAVYQSKQLASRRFGPMWIKRVWDQLYHAE